MFVTNMQILPKMGDLQCFLCNPINGPMAPPPPHFEVQKLCPFIVSMNFIFLVFLHLFYHAPC